MPQDYEDRVERRRERLENAAERARAESDRRHDAADDALRGIEPGQPILVGHHSEKVHRRAIKRHNVNMRKAIDAGKDAQELARRADAVGTGGVSSDDPEAVTKLEQKRAGLIAAQERDKAINAAYRKRNVEALGAFGLDLAALDTQVERAYSWEKQPVPKWRLSNRNAEINRVTKRIAALRAVSATPERSETFGDVTVREDAEENRVCVTFPKERADLRAVLKARGFKWSPTRIAWVRKRGPGVYEIAIHAVQSVAGATTPAA